MKTDHDTPTCEWFALCDHPAIGTVDHPVLGDVPICQRCADRMEYNEVAAFQNGEVVL